MFLNCIPLGKKNKLLKNFSQALQTDRWKETIFDKIRDLYVILYIIYFSTAELTRKEYFAVAHKSVPIPLQSKNPSDLDWNFFSLSFVN